MQVTKTVYLIAHGGTKYDSESGRVLDVVNFGVWPYEKYGDQTAVTKMEVTFEVPDNLNARDLRLSVLEAEKKQLQADFNNRVTEIQRQINELLAIEA
jgi:hypothetical protein